MGEQRSSGSLDKVVKALQDIATSALVFQSMPWLEGVTPRYLRADEPGVSVVPVNGTGLERHYGVFPLDIGLPSVLDHGGLYSDGIFEGMLHWKGKAVLLREHLLRMFEGAEEKRIPVPHSLEEIAAFTLQTIHATALDTGYVRTLLTRGIGDLGVNPEKALGPTLTIIASTIKLYSDQAYAEGLPVALARQTRRVDQRFLPPTTKSLCYGNNIQALLETADQGTAETLMLTADGSIAEATADNVFIVRKDPGWERSPERVVLEFPAESYALPGITRAWIIKRATELDYTTCERTDLMTHDLLRPGTEVFFTGTGARIIHVKSIDGIAIGDGRAGPITRRLQEQYLDFLNSPRSGIAVTASRDELRGYLASGDHRLLKYLHVEPVPAR